MTSPRRSTSQRVPGATPTWSRSMRSIGPGMARPDRSRSDSHLGRPRRSGDRSPPGRLSIAIGTGATPDGREAHIDIFEVQPPAPPDLSQRSGNCAARATQRRRRRLPPRRAQGRGHRVAAPVGVGRARRGRMGQALHAHAFELGATAGAHQGHRRKSAAAEEARTRRRPQGTRRCQASITDGPVAAVLPGIPCLDFRYALASSLSGSGWRARGCGAYTSIRRPR